MFLAREGLSFAMLRVMPAATEAEMRGEQAARMSRDRWQPARARVPG